MIEKGWDGTKQDNSFQKPLENGVREGTKNVGFCSGISVLLKYEISEV